MATSSMAMSVPGATSDLMGSPSMADQVAGETEEERKKRLQKLQASQQTPGASALMGAGYGAALGG